MPARIEYKASVLKDLRKLDAKEAKRVIGKLEKTLRQDPNQGAALKGEFMGLYRLRVGDYRVIYTKTRRGVVVLRIAHRKKVYR